MHSYKYNHMHAGSFACSTGTSTLSYDQSAQCYCWLVSTDGSRRLRAIINDRTFIWAAIVANQFRVLLSTLLNFPECFSNFQFPVSFPLTASSNDTDNGHSGSVAVHCDHVLVSLKKVGGAINCSLISAHFSISAYCLIVQTYKCMRLTTQVYGNYYHMDLQSSGVARPRNPVASWPCMMYGMVNGLLRY